MRVAPCNLVQLTVSQASLQLTVSLVLGFCLKLFDTLSKHGGCLKGPYLCGDQNNIYSSLMRRLDGFQVFQVWSTSKQLLQRKLGEKVGQSIWDLAHGVDDRPVEPPKVRPRGLL